jgi:hypothetical protein
MKYRFNQIRFRRHLVLLLAIWLGAVTTLHADSLDELLVRLKPASLSEAQLRELAGKNGFQPYVANPVLAPGLSTINDWDAGALGSASVIKVGEVYHMYYEAWGKLSEEGKQEDYETLQIGHAVSLDGVHWVKDPANPVIQPGETGTWSTSGTWDPFVRFEDGKFKMWFGGNKSDQCEWAYATSEDGTHFTEHGPISQLGGVEDIHVARDAKTGEYRLYYWDRKQASWDDVMDGLPSPSGLFVATSKNETDFDFANAKRIQIDGQEWPSKYSHIIPHQDGWAMIFGEAVTRGNRSRTGLALSKDGIHWRKSAFPLVDGHDAEIIEAAPNLWLMYYGTPKHFDWPECDLRLAIYEGRLEDLKSTIE